MLDQARPLLENGEFFVSLDVIFGWQLAMERRIHGYVSPSKNKRAMYFMYLVMTSRHVKLSSCYIFLGCIIF